MADDVGNGEQGEFREEHVHDADVEREEDAATRTARLAKERAELELMAAWVAGDRRAGDQLVRAYIHPITRFFQSKIQGRDTVNLLVSETLEALTKSPRQVRTTVKAYIYGIANHVLCHHFRAKKRNREDLIDLTLADLDGGETTFIANQRVETRVVFSALRRIPFNQAMAIEMYWIEDIQAPEIAEILGVPQGTVRGYLRLGLVNLHRRIVRDTRDEQLLARTTTTYTWLRGLIRHIEGLRAVHAEKHKDRPR